MKIFKSDHIDELAAALAKAQSKYTKLKKTKTVSYKGRSYNYADLTDVFEATLPALNANNLSFSQFPSAEANKVTISSFLMHSSGQWLAGDLDMVAFDSNIQTIGSAVTYGRRYAAQSILGINGEEDDDGHLGQTGEVNAGTHVAPKNSSSNAPQNTQNKQPHGQGEAPSDTGSKAFKFNKASEAHRTWLTAYVQKEQYNLKILPTVCEFIHGRSISSEKDLEMWCNQAVASLALMAPDKETK